MEVIICLTLNASRSVTSPLIYFLAVARRDCILSARKVMHRVLDLGFVLAVVGRR